MKKEIIFNDGIFGYKAICHENNNSFEVIRTDDDKRIGDFVWSEDGVNMLFESSSQVFTKTDVNAIQYFLEHGNAISSLFDFEI